MLAVDEDAAARAATRYATVSRTMARFSSPVVRSARSTCRMSDLATSADDRGLGVEQRLDLRVRRPRRRPALRVGAERDEHRVLQVQLGAGPAEELGVLGHRARPAALDEADAELVEQPRDGELVDDRVGDALALGAVAQRRVEHLEGHRGKSFLGPATPTKRPPADAGGLRVGVRVAGALGANNQREMAHVT